MLRLPLLAAGLGAAALMTPATASVINHVNDALKAVIADVGGGPSSGGLFIRIERKGAGQALTATRCQIAWTPGQPGERGRYDKQCSSSPLAQ